MDSELLLSTLRVLRELPLRANASLQTLNGIITVLICLTATILHLLHKRRKTKLLVQSCGLPTVYWRPRFVNYHPDQSDADKKLGSSSITNILPRMKRLKGPFDMYGTVYGLSTPVIHVADPYPATAILSSRRGMTKAPAYDHFKNFSGEGVFTADGQDWKDKRTAVLHALLRSKEGPDKPVERESNVMSKRLVERLRKEIDGQPVNLVPILQRITLELIYRYITHSDLPDNESENPSHLSLYLKAIVNIRMLILARSRSFWFILPDWCYRMFSRMYKDEERTLRPIRKLAKMACETALPGSPLANLKLHSLYSDTSISKNLMDETITLLFAGQDTSAATLSWTLHLLSLYPEIQTKAAAEVHQVFDEDTLLTKKRLSKLPYLDAIVKEAMRLYPVAPFVVRHLTNEIHVTDEKTSVTIPADTYACIWIYALHRNDKYWTQPNDFIPERWLDSRDDCQGAYMPFAVGPRNCVGQPLAQVILRVLLARLLYHFEFHDNRLKPGLDPDSLRLDMQAGFTVLPKGGVNLALKMRESPIDSKQSNQ